MLTSIAIILLFGLLVGWLFSKMKLPSLLGMIIVGIVLSPHCLNLVDDSILTISGDLRQIINDYMPVVPVVTTTAETAFSWKVGEDTFQKSVSAGTWEFPEMELQEGKNTLTVTGNGTTTFRYREGRL